MIAHASVTSLDRWSLLESKVTQRYCWALLGRREVSKQNPIFALAAGGRLGNLGTADASEQPNGDPGGGMSETKSVLREGGETFGGGHPPPGASTFRYPPRPGANNQSICVILA